MLLRPFVLFPGCAGHSRTAPVALDVAIQAVHVAGVDAPVGPAEVALRLRHAQPPDPSEDGNEPEGAASGGRRIPRAECRTLWLAPGRVGHIYAHLSYRLPSVMGPQMQAIAYCSLRHSACLWG
jgi:hypothetical protein